MTYSQTPSIHYTLGMSKPSTHLFELEVALTNLPANDTHIDFLIPAWRTGRYVIFDFAGSVQEFSADDGNKKPLRWSKIDKQTWRVEKQGGSITVRYKVFANEFNMRTKGLNDEHGFVDPASAFMYVDAYKNLPLHVTVDPFGKWHVTTGLEAVKGAKNKFFAPNFEYLADCPIEVGNQKDHEFRVEEKNHVFMVFGEGNMDPEKTITDITKLIKANKEFWGELPYERYVFMLHLTPSAGGGTEHINSTIMGMRPLLFKNPAAYQGFMGLVSHEYFHTWNVKQLRPSGIHPYDFSIENYVRELWIAEGTTDYYGPLLLVRNNFITTENFLQRLANSVQQDRLKPGNRIQTLTESSFDAWIKYWRNSPNAYNVEADYYDKGADVSLLLDMEIRQSSGNKASLDHVMKAMFQRFRLDAKGYTVEDFQEVCEEFSGKDLKQFFADYVHGVKALDWERSLGYAGLELTARDSAHSPWLGAQTRDEGSGARITRIVAGSPAQEAGLDQGDEILSINGFRVRTQDLLQRIPEMKAGDKLTFTVFRDDKLREFEVTLKNHPVPAYRLGKVKNPSDEQKAIYETWLRTKW